MTLGRRGKQFPRSRPETNLRLRDSRQVASSGLVESERDLWREGSEEKFGMGFCFVPVGGDFGGGITGKRGREVPEVH